MKETRSSAVLVMIGKNIGFDHSLSFEQNEEKMLRSVISTYMVTDGYGGYAFALLNKDGNAWSVSKPHQRMDEYGNHYIKRIRDYYTGQIFDEGQERIINSVPPNLSEFPSYNTNNAKPLTPNDFAKVMTALQGK